MATGWGCADGKVRWLLERGKLTPAENHGLSSRNQERKNRDACYGGHRWPICLGTGTRSNCRSKQLPMVNGGQLPSDWVCEHSRTASWPLPRAGGGMFGWDFAVFLPAFGQVHSWAVNICLQVSLEMDGSATSRRLIWPLLWPGPHCPHTGVATWMSLSLHFLVILDINPS